MHNDPKFNGTPSPSRFTAALTLGLCLMLGGCFNQQEVTTSLGSVSIGQQLIDLKKARDSGSLTRSEYEQSKEALLNMLQSIGDDEDIEYDDDDDDDRKNRRKNGSGADDEDDDKDDDDDDDDEKSGFLF